MSGRAHLSAFAANTRIGIPDELARRYRGAGWWNSRTLADGIETAAALRPDAVAIAEAGSERCITYAELNNAVARAVAVLRSRATDAESGAILVAGNSIRGVVAYHALLRANAPTLLLDRRCGTADVEHAYEVLPDATLIAPMTELDRLVAGAGDNQRIALESLDGHATDTAYESSGLDRDAPATVLFTSGTTNRPKAVVHSLNTLTAGAANMAQITGADDTTRLFLVSPLTSIAGVMQILLAADQHAAIVLEDQFDPDASLDRINRWQATLLGGAPVIAERLLRAAQDRGENIALRTLALGGAMLPRPLLEVATDAFGIEIARVYGSSEAPNFSGSVPTDERERRLSDDGVLMPGNEVRVGSTGHAQEGMLRGPCVFLGYVDPEDQADAFEGGWFRTGDLVDLHNGRLTVVGRLKAVANRSGLKISLDEIEAALADMDGIRELACVAFPDADTGERLAVAVRPEPRADLTLERVVTHLLDRGVAHRKLPEEVVVWESPLPRTTSGKIVRSRVVMESPGKPSLVAARLRDAARGTDHDSDSS